MEKDKTLNCQIKTLDSNIDYISNFKHDFAIPIVAQIRALELLSDEKLGVLNIEQKEIVNLTLNSCRLLKSMISDILYMNDLQKNNIELSLNKNDIIKIFKESFVAKNFEYKYKNFFIRILNTENVKIIRCDKENIRKSFDYILDYVFSCAKENTHIVSIIENHNKYINFSIDFENPFIQNEHLNKIGSSLKLELAQKVFEAHKGKLTVENSVSKTIIKLQLKII